MAAPDRKTPRLDPSSQAPEVYTHSSLPEVYAQPSTLPEATTPAHGYHHHHQYKEEQSWGQPPSAVSSHAYSESQGGWTSVSQGGLETVAEQAGDKSGQGGNSEGEQKQQQPKTIMGLPRRKFWLIIGPLLLLLAIGLAVGLGVGLSARTASAAATAASAAPTPVACPADNGTIYTPAATNGGGGSNISSFMIVCDTDYNGNDPASGTTDLASKACGSVEECMAICAGNRDCAGAWFGDYFGRKCFLKSRLGVSHFSQNSFFVIKQQS